MLEQSQIDQVTGGEVYGSDGEKIGKVGQIYVDDRTGQPEWATR
ncbi:MAG: PRC-barrel domain-containing protein [Nocardioidaceae bacterium]